VSYGGNGGGTTAATGVPGLGTITQFTSRIKPYDTYMIVGGGFIVLLAILGPRLLKNKIPKELMYVGVPFLIFGLYLKYGSSVGLPS